ncbi:MAG: hypothetical protein NVS2B14_08790 [Chamaesiphon sp.]
MIRTFYKLVLVGFVSLFPFIVLADEFNGNSSNVKNSVAIF